MLISDSRQTTLNEEKINVVVYSCTDNERKIINEYDKKMNVNLIITHKDICAENISLIKKCNAISINHRVKINKKLLDILFESGVRYISTRTIGYDHIDIEYAKKIGIKIGNITYSTNSVADYTIMLILMATRNMKTVFAKTQMKDYTLPLIAGRQLNELTVGIIGTGAIGKKVISHIKGFGCKILANSLYEEEEVKRNAEYVDFETLISKSDVISLHIPACKENYHIINEKTISKMKTGCYLINTSRGSLINTSDLIKAIENKKLSGVALDVIENENGIFYNDLKERPLSNKELEILSSYTNVIITPHMAFHTDVAIKDMVLNSLNNCIDFSNQFNKVYINELLFKN